uniref:Uncharacterized protein n=1 Tax=Sphaerodactylus townsendi TaxID=933632 RepID=A0ACB8F886_9SAUR
MRKYGNTAAAERRKAEGRQAWMALPAGRWTRGSSPVEPPPPVAARKEHGRQWRKNGRPATPGQHQGDVVVEDNGGHCMDSRFGMDNPTVAGMAMEANGRYREGRGRVDQATQ